MDDILIKIHQKRHQKALFTLELFDAFSYLNVKDYFQVNLNIYNKRPVYSALRRKENPSLNPPSRLKPKTT